MSANPIRELDNGMIVDFSDLGNVLNNLVDKQLVKQKNDEEKFWAIMDVFFEIFGQDKCDELFFREFTQSQKTELVKRLDLK